MPLAQPCGVWFPGWEGALARFPVSPPRRQEYRQAVIRFLHFCRETRQVASVPAARAFIETVLPASLTERLRAHRERLRELYANDRSEQVPGVWIPEGLDRKYPKAGQSWEWQWRFPSRELMNDPRSGIRRRHHVLRLQGEIRKAARHPAPRRSERAFRLARLGSKA